MKYFLCFISTVFLVSCGQTSSQIVEDLPAPIFQNFIKGNQGLIVDVRTPQEFYSGHLVEATNIDFYSEDFKNRLQLLRKDKPIYVYCKSGGRSSSAASIMESLGFAKVYNLIGGITSWNSHSYFTVQSKAQEIKTNPILSLKELKNILETNKNVLLAFTTEWCVPCKKMNPIINQIKNEKSNCEVLFIDADANNVLVKEYQIKGVPVFLFFKKSREVFRHVGVISKEELLNQIN